MIRDLDLLQRLPYVWLSITVETDNLEVVRRLGGGPTIDRRFEVVRTAAKAGVPVQIVVSPCLPYTPDFADRLASSGARRIVVDDFMEGDGSGGKRTASSPFASSAGYDWHDSQPARDLYEKLRQSDVEVGWSAAGFCSIKTERVVQQPTLL